MHPTYNNIRVRVSLPLSTVSPKEAEPAGVGAKSLFVLLDTGEGLRLLLSSLSPPHLVPAVHSVPCRSATAAPPPRRPLRSDKLAPERERELGKMLVAAVQLELFQMLDDICEAGDMENELFDDLCTDTIQDGRRAGFIALTAELLLSPGSGYKRLLQIRKDQVCFDRGSRVRARVRVIGTLSCACLERGESVP